MYSREPTSLAMSEQIAPSPAANLTQSRHLHPLGHLTFAQPSLSAVGDWGLCSVGLCGWFVCGWDEQIQRWDSFIRSVVLEKAFESDDASVCSHSCSSTNFQDRNLPTKVSQNWRDYERYEDLSRKTLHDPMTVKVIITCFMCTYEEGLLRNLYPGWVRCLL